jgi:hypothetical protein
MSEKREPVTQKEIVRFDSSRDEFIRRYFYVEPENPIFYGPTLKTGNPGFEAAGAVVVDALSFTTGPLAGGV